MLVKDLLKTLTFGQRVAEEEAQHLAEYFVETDQWKRMVRDDIDIVYGPKGSGKSALYGLLLARKDALFDTGVLVVGAENPRDAPAFKELVFDPPSTEREFEYLWKLYFLCLVGQVFGEYSVDSSEARSVLTALQESGLLPRERNLPSLLRAALTYVRRRLTIESFETGLKIDPVTGLPAGFTGKITMRNPSDDGTVRGLTSVDDLLRLSNKALCELRYFAWIALDRLDAVFCEEPVLEERALRALFRVYLDLRGLDHFRLKIFLRSDIWSRISHDGFREASHITRSLTISWDRDLLLNLVVRRLLNNAPVMGFYEVEREEVLRSTETQRSFFYRAFPPTVQGRRFETIDWMISRTQDGLEQPSPREIIHLLNRAREIQLQRLDIGGKEPENRLLFHRGVIKDALPEVSQVRLQLTIFTEFPGLRSYIEALKAESSVQTPTTLARIWAVPVEEATKIGTQLVDVGILKSTGSKARPNYEVPFVYRSALNVKATAPDEEE